MILHHDISSTIFHLLDYVMYVTHTKCFTELEIFSTAVMWK